MSSLRRKSPAKSKVLITLSDDEGPSTSASPPKRKRDECSAPVKFHSSSPIGFYFTKVKGIAAPYNEFLSIDIKDILSPKFGDLQESVQFNYEIDLDWLVEQYSPEFRKLPLLVVHQAKEHLTTRLKKEAASFPHIKLCPIFIRDPFGTHHSKMMFLRYSDGLRVVISTANLVESDWRRKTQSVWISPLFPPVSETETSKDSPTSFQSDLIDYLTSYHSKELNKWIAIVKRRDMSKANVVLIASVPGRHSGEQKNKYGHLRLRQVLAGHGPEQSTVKANWPVVGQFSSIGSLGASASNWLTSEFLMSMKTTRAGTMASSLSCNTPLKLVFPANEDVKNSLEGYMAGGSLPYSIKTHQKQTYLKSFMHRWISEEKGRTQASPHIKTFFRVSPDYKQAAWFYTGSANLSKAAWGVLEKSNSQLAIKSYEIGVLFLPKFFGSQPLFNISAGLCVDGDGSTTPLSLPMPIDLPLTPYSKDDEPWCWDVPKRTPDICGNIWAPD